MDPRLQVDKSKCEGEDFQKRKCLTECQVIQTGVFNGGRHLFFFFDYPRIICFLFRWTVHGQAGPVGRPVPHLVGKPPEKDTELVKIRSQQMAGNTASVLTVKKSSVILNHVP